MTTSKFIASLSTINPGSECQQKSRRIIRDSGLKAKTIRTIYRQREGFLLIYDNHLTVGTRDCDNSANAAVISATRSLTRRDKACVPGNHYLYLPMVSTTLAGDSPIRLISSYILQYLP